MVLLDIPFLSMLYPFKVTNESIIIDLIGHVIKFKFSKETKWHEINNLKSKINEKRKFVYSLKKKVGHKTIKNKIV